MRRRRRPVPSHTGAEVRHWGPMRASPVAVLLLSLGLQAARGCTVYAGSSTYASAPLRFADGAYILRVGVVGADARADSQMHSMQVRLAWAETERLAVPRHCVSR